MYTINCYLLNSIVDYVYYDFIAEVIETWQRLVEVLNYICCPMDKELAHMFQNVGFTIICKRLSKKKNDFDDGDRKKNLQLFTLFATL